MVNKFFLKCKEKCILLKTNTKNFIKNFLNNNNNIEENNNEVIINDAYRIYNIYEDDLYEDNELSLTFLNDKRKKRLFKNIKKNEIDLNIINEEFINFPKVCKHKPSYKEKNECIICFSNKKKEVNTFICDHSFCKECLIKWYSSCLEKEKLPYCPLCIKTDYEYIKILYKTIC